MALFKKSAEPAPTPEPNPAGAQAPGAKKNVPTPTRRQAEAARRERLNPALSPKEARRRERDATYEARQKSFSAQEDQPARQLLRDHVDSRFNPAEFAMPVLLAVMAATLVPSFAQIIDYFLYVSWGYIALMVADAYLMWRRGKQLLAERLPGTPLKGLLMYAFNRQMTFRRWRRPAPRVKRGEKI